MTLFMFSKWINVFYMCQASVDCFLGLIFFLDSFLSRVLEIFLLLLLVSLCWFFFFFNSGFVL